MGIKERRARERRARKKTVLDAARALVLERGFNGTTTRQIADRCELSEATLFFYFKSKDEILTSLLFEGIDFMGRGLRTIAASDQSGQDKIHSLWRFFTQVAMEHPEYFHVFGYLAHPRATTSVSDEVVAEIAHRSGENLRRFAGILSETVGPERSRVVADLIWGAFAGLVLMRDSRVNLGLAPRPDEADLALAIELLLSGLLRRDTDRSSP